MNIGKLNDAKTVESLRQATQLDTFVLDAEHVRLSECRTSDMRQANCERTQRRVCLWRDTSALVPSNGSRHILGLDGANLPGRRLVGGAHYRDLTSGTQPWAPSPQRRCVT